jgi:hypothetical protein
MDSSAYENDREYRKHIISFIIVLTDYWLKRSVYIAEEVFP